MIDLYPEFFNDVFGPVMQPGSSSHMAAPCRLGFMAHSMLGEKPKNIRIVADKDGSFAGTFGLMNEDKGMVAGALGLLPDDVRLFRSRVMAAEQGITYSFDFTSMKESPHINAMKFILTGESGQVVSLVGDSTGGGMVETRVVNGFPLRFKGDTYLLLFFNSDGVYGADDFRRFGDRLDGMVEGGHVEKASGGTLYYFRTGMEPDLQEAKNRFPGAEVRLIRPVLPVITRTDKKPQLFDTMTSWRELAKDGNKRMWEVALDYEVAASGWEPARVMDYMKGIAQKMHRQTRAAYEENLPVLDNPFKAQLNDTWTRYLESSTPLAGDVMASAVKWAWGAGVATPGVEIVPGPMGTGGGFVYSALSSVKESRNIADEDLWHGLFVAAGIGAIAYTRTNPTGEVIGCAGECGICGAMAAGAVTEMVGGTPEQVENAASLSLQSALGWPCDPIPGGNEQPCNSRVMVATCMSIVFADLALSGRTAVLPFHEVVDIADNLGRKMSPDLLCTSRGGSCEAPSAKVLSEKYNRWYEEKNRS